MPRVGIGLSDEFVEFDFLTTPSAGVSGTPLGSGGVPFYDYALVDTGAQVSLLSASAFSNFGLGEPFPGNPDGYAGTETIDILGVGGTEQLTASDALGIYAGGLQDRVSDGASLGLDGSLLAGQINSSIGILDPSSTLQNVLGLSFLSQYAVSVKNDQPQVFQLGGQTIRTPSVEFGTLGSAPASGLSIPLKLDPLSAFEDGPFFIFNLDLLSDLNEDPQVPTFLAGSLFVDALATDGASSFAGPKDFLLDTGAAVTVLSTASALELGIDAANSPPDFTLTVTGGGGVVSAVPGFYLDEFSLPGTNGDFTQSNVPVLVFDVTDPRDPENFVDGIVGTNLFAGRNYVLDPVVPSGAGSPDPRLVVSDTVTESTLWVSPALSADWESTSSWSTSQVPDELSNIVLEPVGANNQQAILGTPQLANAVTIAGSVSGPEMQLVLGPGAALTLFGGVEIQNGGALALQSGMLDTLDLDVVEGRLEGEGTIKSQTAVNVRGGTISPEGSLMIEGALEFDSGSLLEITLRDAGMGDDSDQLLVSSSISFAGVLSVDLAYGPAIGDVFTIATYSSRFGEFEQLLLPAALLWDVTYGPTSLTLEVLGTAVDRDGDFDIDVADLLAWQRDDGSVMGLTNWQAGFGEAGNTTVVVPETATSLLVLAGLLPFTRRRN